MIYLGIDPGNSGAIAVIEGEEITTLPLKETERDAIDLVYSCAVQSCPCFAYLELVHSMPQQGVSSTFKFGQSYGFCRGILLSQLIPFETVTPAKWQREFSLPTLKQCDGSNTKKKNAHKARAQELFPELKISHAIADALLIAEYCRRVRTNAPA